MSHIKKYNDFLKESFTEFNLQRLNPDSAQASIHVDDPQLSTNAFDKHEDKLRAAMSRIDDIIINLKGTSTYSQLRSALGLDDQNIKSIKILKIVKTDNINYDVYVAIKIQNEEYWGKVSNILNNPDFKSEIFKDYDLYQPKEWIIKTKGLVIKTIKEWLKPEPGMYKLLNDKVICYSNDTGKQLEMGKDIEIELVRAYDNKLVIKYENNLYNLNGDNHIYFNWWFVKLD